MKHMTQEQFNYLVDLSIAMSKRAPMWPSFDDWVSLGDAVEPVIERLRQNLEDQNNGGAP
jgi:hypothetical protein